MAKTIGIDLGTTNSCVAVIEGGEPVVIANAEGARTTPSVVAFSKTGERMVGQVAKRQAITNPERTISSIKREMGSDYKVTIDGKSYTPQEISAMILQKLKADAEAYLGETVSSGAITALQQACQPIGKALIQSVMNAQGVSVIAAFNAVSRVDDFACIPEQSISSSMMTCIAQNRGAGEHARVGETLRRGMMIEAVYGVLICAAVLLAKEPVMRLFAAQDSMQMVSMGVDYLTLMAFFYILPCITNGIQGYFRGMGEMKTTLVATFIQISIRALVVAVLVPRVGLNGAAWACAIGWSAMLCYTFARYRKVRTNE